MNIEKLIEWGKANKGTDPYCKRPSSKKDDPEMTRLAKAFQSLSESKRAQLQSQGMNNSLPRINEERDTIMESVFGQDWFKKTKQSWKKDEDQIMWIRQFIDDRKLSPEDWYTITVDDFKNGGLGLIDKYNNSIKTLLDKFGSVLYPDFEWQEWKFGRVVTWGIPYRHEYKIDEENTTKYEIFKKKVQNAEPISKHKIPLFRQFMEYVMTEEKISDIHSLTHSHLVKYDGSGLLGIGGDFKQLLQYAFPEKSIHLYLLHPIRREFWEDDSNIRAVLEYYCSQKDIPIDRLIEVSKQDMVNFGGWYGLKKIRENGSWIDLLRRAFPEIEWDPFNVCRMLWSRENKIQCLKKLAELEEWTELEDYYGLTIALCEKYNLHTLLGTYANSPIKLLRDLKPEYEWKEWRFSKSNLCWSIEGEPNIPQIRAYFDEFVKENNLQSLKEIAQYCVKDFPQGIFIHYNFNLCTCMKSIYPEMEWSEAEFQAINYSKASIRCFEELGRYDPRLKDIKHKLNGGEVRIGKYPVDGYITLLSYDDCIDILNSLPSYCNAYKHQESTNIIIQFHGSYWHGHPDIFESTNIHPQTKKTYGELYERTQQITKTLLETCHVIEIWEHDYNSY